MISSVVSKKIEEELYLKMLIKQTKNSMAEIKVN